MIIPRCDDCVYDSPKGCIITGCTAYHEKFKLPGGKVMEKNCRNCLHGDNDLQEIPCCDCDDTTYDKWEPEEHMVGVNNMIEHPEHYTSGGIECIEAIHAALTADEFRGYIKGNIIKYAWRERHKGGDEDLKKIRAYVDLFFRCTE
jgi:hypothetical protein